MRKFLLLIFVSLIAFSCKKQVVEPILVQNNPVNLYPKKVVKQRNVNGVDKFTIYKFKYNSSNLVSEVIMRDSLSQDSTKTLFIYENGVLKSKTEYWGSKLFAETYMYNDVFKLVSIRYIGSTPYRPNLKIVYDNPNSSLFFADIKYIIDSDSVSKNDSLVFTNSFTKTSESLFMWGKSKVLIYDKNRNLRDSVIYNINSSTNAKFDYWYNINQNYSEEYTFSEKNINLQYELREYILPILKTSMVEKFLLKMNSNNNYYIKGTFGTDSGSVSNENSYTFDSFDRLVKIIEGANTSNSVTINIYY